MKKIADPYDRSCALGMAYGLLQRALEHAAAAGAPRAAAKIRRAIKSTGGAHRHAVGRHLRGVAG